MVRDCLSERLYTLYHLSSLLPVYRKLVQLSKLCFAVGADLIFVL